MEWSPRAQSSPKALSIPLSNPQAILQDSTPDAMSPNQRAVHVITSLSSHSPDLSLLVDSSRTYDESLLYWKFFSKAKDVLPQSQRVENLTWRLLHLNLKKEQTRKEEESKLLSIATPPETPIPTASLPFIPISSPLSTSHSSNSPLDSPHPLAASYPTAYSSSLPNSILASLPSSLLTCTNCSTTVTPLWRRDAFGKPLCNACGLFHKLHAINRPVHLNRGTIKKRVRLKKPTSQFMYVPSNARLAQDIKNESLVNSPTFSTMDASLYSPSNTPQWSMPKLIPTKTPLFHPHSFAKQPIVPPSSTQHSTEQLFKSLMSDQAGFSLHSHPQTLKRQKPDSDSLVTRYEGLNQPVYASSLPYRTNAYEAQVQGGQRFMNEHSECSLSEMFTKNEAYIKCKPETVAMATTTSLYPAHTSLAKPSKVTLASSRVSNQAATYMDMLLDSPSYPSSLPTTFSHPNTHISNSALKQGSILKDSSLYSSARDVREGRSDESYSRDACLIDTMMLSKVMQSEEPYGAMSESWLDAYLAE